MKKKLFLSMVLITLSFSNLTYSASWLDSLTDKLMNSIGADKLLDKVNDMTSIINSLEDIGNELKNFDVDSLTQKMMVKTFDKYKELGCDFLPDNYKNMTWEEIKTWCDENEEKLKAWINTLDPETVEEANKWATENIIPMTDPIMNKVNELEKPLNDLQGKVNEIEPLLDNFINGYKDLYSVLQDKDKALALLEQYPEWNQVKKDLDEFAKYYTEGDKVRAFKKLDDITGIFSNSEAGKGLGILFETAESINLGKYLAKIAKILVPLGGSDPLKDISEEQIEEVFNEYIKEFNEKAGIKSNSENSDKVKGLLDKYLKDIDAFEKNAKTLDKIANSPVGDFVKKQLEGKGKEALEDVMSKYSGVDKKTIRDSGLLDKIFEFASSLFAVK